MIDVSGKYIGKTFGQLTIIEYIPGLNINNKRMIARVKCICTCSKSIEVNLNHLRSGHTKSCGCVRITHGLRNIPEYRLWNAMKNRCSNPNNKNYKNYGGRGIKVYENWIGENGFLNFLDYLDSTIGRRPTEHPKLGKYSLDRFPSNDGPYAPDNIRWATSDQQHANKTQAHQRELEYLRSKIKEQEIEIQNLKFQLEQK